MIRKLYRQKTLAPDSPTMLLLEAENDQWSEPVYVFTEEDFRKTFYDGYRASNEAGGCWCTKLELERAFEKYEPSWIIYE